MYGAEVSSPHGHALRCIDLARKIRRLRQGADNLTLDENCWRCRRRHDGEMVPQLKKHLSDGSCMPPDLDAAAGGRHLPQRALRFRLHPQSDRHGGGSVTPARLTCARPRQAGVRELDPGRKGRPAELREKMRKQTTRLFALGHVEQDDSDTWPHMTLAPRVAAGQEMTLKYQAVYETGKPEAGPGPGIITKASLRTTRSGLVA